MSKFTINKIPNDKVILIFEDKTTNPNYFQRLNVQQYVENDTQNYSEGEMKQSITVIHTHYSNQWNGTSNLKLQ